MFAILVSSFLFLSCIFFSSFHSFLCSFLFFIYAVHNSLSLHIPENHLDLPKFAHEVKNTLQCISSSIELLLEQKSNSKMTSEEMRQSLLITAKESLDYLMILVTTTLDDHEHKGDDRQTGKKKIVRISDIIKALRGFQCLAMRKGIRFTINAEEQVENLIFESDFTKIIQTLSNLITNSIKFTEYGFVELRISATDYWVLFSVKDTGKGIDPSSLDKIFEPRVQENEKIRRKFGGNGLGLWIVSEACTTLGACLDVESIPRQGSCFSISIPIRGDLFHNGVGNKLNILIIEDNDVTKKLMRKSLTQACKNVNMECDIKDVSSAEEALSYCNFQFDLVFMDMGLKGISGLEAVKLVQSYFSNYSMLILVTACSGNELEKASKLADGVLKKPFSTKDLHGFVHMFKRQKNLTDGPLE